MKKTCLLLFCLIGAVPCFSQERPRVFDNFDTVRGVQVYIPTQTAMAVKARRTPGKTPTVDQKLNKRTAMVTPVQPKTNRRLMNPGEGLADGEMARFTSSRPVVSMGSSSGLKGFTTGDI